ncbi:MAG: hypothetical protein IJ218_07310 [Alphaproteobacteria bacterium]|nr:hypothetical protein [Alphaproteobacteria bacterium]
MNKKNLKTFIIGAVTTLLTSCGVKSNDAPKDDAKVQNPTELTVDDNISPDKFMDYIADAVSRTQWKNISRGETDLVQDTQIIKEFLKMNNIPYEKGDSVLSSADFVYETESDPHTTRFIGSKLINPIYEKAQKTRKTNVEQHEDVAIRRKEFNEIPQEIKTISLAKVEKTAHEEHLEKVKKMVEDKKLERELHKGDTVEVRKFMPPTRNGTTVSQAIVKEQAVVQKDGVSPTYKEYDKTKNQYIMKLKFDYTYSDKN